MTDLTTMFGLHNQVAIVTGGGGVLGGAMAEGLAMAGAKVAVVGRTLAKCEETAERIRSKGGESIGLACDVLSEESLTDIRFYVKEKWKRIDCLLNVAGGNIKGAVISPEQNFFDLEIDAFDDVVDLNLKGTVLPCMIICREMANQRSGSVINISSLAAFRPFSRVVGYSVAKAAIENFTMWLANEMNAKYGSGIRVNCIAPGVFVGKQNYNLLYDEEGSLSKRGQQLIDHTPMQRFGEPDELAGAAIWLCSQGAKFVNGAVIPVDGGFLSYAGV